MFVMFVLPHTYFNKQVISPVLDKREILSIEAVVKLHYFLSYKILEIVLRRASRDERKKFLLTHTCVNNKAREHNIFYIISNYVFVYCTVI